MFKKLAATALILTVAVTGAACSKEAAKPAASPSPSAAASENPDAYKMSAYVSVRLAEEKVDVLFHQSKSKDGKPILNPLIATDKDKGAKFLIAYYDQAMTDKILTHYLTADKADDSVVVKEAKFFPASFIKAAATKDDVTYEGTKDEVKLTTKDNVVYTVKKNAEGKYVITNIAKK